MVVSTELNRMLRCYRSHHWKSKNRRNLNWTVSTHHRAVQPFLKSAKDYRAFEKLIRAARATWATCVGRQPTKTDRMLKGW